MAQITVICLILIDTTIALGLKTCPTTVSKHYLVTWPETANLTLSSPPCVDKNKEFLYRQCLEGVWDEEPECDYIQDATLPECPDGFMESQEYGICYKSQKTTFPPKCPFEDVLPFEAYKKLIENNGPFWMPVVRNLDKGLGFLQWNEPNSLYKTDFEGEYSFVAPIKGKDCLLYYNSSYIEAVSCKEEHLSICAFSKLDQLEDDYCSALGSCRRSDYTASSKCFCLGSSENSRYVKAEFLKPYQNSIYRRLSNDSCSIGLFKSKEGFIWNSSNRKIDYTFWSADAVFDNNHIYGALTPKGWILTKALLPCCLFEKEIRVLPPNLSLQFDSENLKFTLKISSPTTFEKLNSFNLLLYCFADVAPLNLFERFSVFKNSSVTYSFSPTINSPGNFWCESFNYVTLEVVRSNVISVRSSFPFVFVSVIRLSYEQENPLTQTIIGYIEEVIKQKLPVNSNVIKYSFRVAKILDVNETMKIITVNVHLISASLNEGKTHDEEYQTVKTEMKTIFRTKLIDFLSLDYCVTEKKNKLTWPSTRVGSETMSAEYCFKEDGNRLTRWCLGDLLNGARWADLNENCTLYNESTVTSQLLNYITNANQEDVLEISQQFQKFYSVDIYVFGEIFLNSYSSFTNMTIFGTILNNLLNVENWVIRKAQQKMKATNRILRGMEKIFDNFINRTESMEVCTNNLYLKMSSIGKLSGVLEKTRSCTGITSLDLEKVEKVINYAETVNATSAVWLPYDCGVSMMEPIMIMIFFKNSFFDNQANPIFRIVAPGSDISGCVFIAHVAKKGTTCLFWDYSEENQGSWKIGSDVDRAIKTYDVCNHYSENPYVVIGSEDSTSDNITESLIEILESSDEASETINKLYDISGKYTNFTPTDVFLVGKIFEKVNQGGIIDLKILAETISNVEKIPRKVLSESQMSDRSTDNILLNLDQIVNSNTELQVEAISDDFIIFIFNTKETNFSGLALLEFNETYQMKILEGDADLNEISSYENLDSAVVLSPELKRQLDEDSRIIITFFSSDALFNEKEVDSKSVSKIFGVILPGIGAYSGPITMLQKVAKNDFQEHCAHWNYNTTLSGFWLKDQDGEELSSFTACEFWHTTHFAVLLVDENKYENDQVLDWITNINCFLSSLGLFCIFLTAALFKKWRQNAGNKILLNFAFANSLQIIFFYMSSYTNRDPDNFLLCTILGMLLHYSVISGFCWMLVIAFLQYKRFVQVLGGPPQHILLKGCLLGWLFPLCPVMLVFAFGTYNTINPNVGICYPTGLGLYLGIWFPVFSIILVNLAFFMSIMHSVFNKRTDCASGASDDLIFQWRLAFLLFFLLGLSWLFGLLALMDFGNVFTYLFCVTASLQGFILFLFFIVFNAYTRFLYGRILKKCLCKD